MIASSTTTFATRSSSQTVVPRVSNSVDRQETPGEVIIVGVVMSVITVVLMAAILTVTSLVVCLRRKTKKRRRPVAAAENVSFNCNRGQVTLTTNSSGTEYDYVACYTLSSRPRTESDGLTDNVAYVSAAGRDSKEVMTDNVAYGVRQNELNNLSYAHTGGEAGERDEDDYDYVKVSPTCTPMKLKE